MTWTPITPAFDASGRAVIDYGQIADLMAAHGLETNEVNIQVARMALCAWVRRWCKARGIAFIGMDIMPSPRFDPRPYTRGNGLQAEIRAGRLWQGCLARMPKP